MVEQKLLGEMILIAIMGHAGQFDKGGKPYILHPLRVMSFIKVEDEELLCIAVGHDLLEDTNITEDMLLDAGMTPRIVAGIKALTKVSGRSYEEYKQAVMANPDAVLVKMADLRHNSDLRRLQGTTDKDLARVEKYQKFYKELEAING